MIMMRFILPRLETRTKEFMVGASTRVDKTRGMRNESEQRVKGRGLLAILVVVLVSTLSWQHEPRRCETNCVPPWWAALKACAGWVLLFWGGACLLLCGGAGPAKGARRGAFELEHAP